MCAWTLFLFLFLVGFFALSHLSLLVLYWTGVEPLQKKEKQGKEEKKRRTSWQYFSHLFISPALDFRPPLPRWEERRGEVGGRGGRKRGDFASHQIRFKKQNGEKKKHLWTFFLFFTVLKWSQVLLLLYYYIIIIVATVWNPFFEEKQRKKTKRNLSQSALLVPTNMLVWPSDCRGSLFSNPIRNKLSIKTKKTVERLETVANAEGFNGNDHATYKLDSKNLQSRLTLPESYFDLSLCFYPSSFSPSRSSLLAFFHFSPFPFVFLSLSLFVVLHTIIHTCNKQKQTKKKINSLLFDTLLHVGLVGLVETSSIPTKKNNSKKQNMSFFMYCFCRCSVLVRFKDDKTTYIWNTVFTNAYQGWPQRHDGRGRFPTPSAGRPVELSGVWR